MVGVPVLRKRRWPRWWLGKAGQVAVAYYGKSELPGAPFPDKCYEWPDQLPSIQDETWEYVHYRDVSIAVRAPPVFWSACYKTIRPYRLVMVCIPSSNRR